MTEKRADYRKHNRKNHSKRILKKINSAFSDREEDSQAVDVNADFKRDAAEHEQLLAQDREDYLKQEQELSQTEKGLRLKKKLDRAILLVVVLIVLVLLSLFYL